MTADQLARYLRELADRIEARGVQDKSITLEWKTPTEIDQARLAAYGVGHRKHTGEYILNARWFWKEKA